MKIFFAVVVIVLLFVIGVHYMSIKKCHVFAGTSWHLRISKNKGKQLLR